MKKPTLEHLSSFLDGEAAEGEQSSLLDALESDAEMSAAWSHYHLIGDALRKTLPDHVSMDFSQRVSAAIAEEPTVLAPPRPRPHRFVKPLAGLAIAATVAGVAVLGVQHLERTLPETRAPQMAQQQPAVAAPQAQFATVNAVQSQNPDLSARHQEFSPRLSSYLVNHSEYKTSLGMQGMLPYVRIVGYESDQ